MANPILGWQPWGNTKSVIASDSEYMCGAPGSWRDFSTRLTQFLPLAGVGLMVAVAGSRSALSLPASVPQELNLKRVFLVGVLPDLGVEWGR